MVVLASGALVSIGSLVDDEAEVGIVVDVVDVVVVDDEVDVELDGAVVGAVVASAVVVVGRVVVVVVVEGFAVVVVVDEAGVPAEVAGLVPPEAPDRPDEVEAEVALPDRVVAVRSPPSDDESVVPAGSSP